MCSADDVEFILCYSSQQSFIFPKVSNYFLRTTWSICFVQPQNVNNKTHQISMQIGPFLKTQTELLHPQRILLFTGQEMVCLSGCIGQKESKERKSGRRPLSSGRPPKRALSLFQPLVQCRFKQTAGETFTVNKCKTLTKLPISF